MSQKIEYKNKNSTTIRGTSHCDNMIPCSLAVGYY